MKGINLKRYRKLYSEHETEIDAGKLSAGGIQRHLRGMDQVTFPLDGVKCDKFVLNKMRMNAKNAKVVCVDCSNELLQHCKDAVSEDDVCAYLSHIEAKVSFWFFSLVLVFSSFLAGWWKLYFGSKWRARRFVLWR